MGCDIHGIFQRQNEDGEWEDLASTWDQERHYDLFTWLAGVRNMDGITPIRKPRGFPKDFIVFEQYRHPIPANAYRGPRRAKFETAEDVSSSDSCLVMLMGDHSHSWLGADEILLAPDQMLREQGVMTLKDYEKWDKVSSPKTVLNPRWKAKGEDIYQIDLPGDIGPNTTHVSVEYQTSLRERLAYFIDEVQRLRDLYGKVRLVFGFDS